MRSSGDSRQDTLSIGSLVGEKNASLSIPRWACSSLPGLTGTPISVAANRHLGDPVVFILRGRMPWWGLCIGMFFFAAYAIPVFAFQF